MADPWSQLWSPSPTSDPPIGTRRPRSWARQSWLPERPEMEAAAPHAFRARATRPSKIARKETSIHNPYSPIITATNLN